MEVHRDITRHRSSITTPTPQQPTPPAQFGDDEYLPPIGPSFMRPLQRLVLEQSKSIPKDDPWRRILSQVVSHETQARREIHSDEEQERSELEFKALSHYFRLRRAQSAQATKPQLTPMPPSTQPPPKRHCSSSSLPEINNENPQHLPPITHPAATSQHPTATATPTTDALPHTTPPPVHNDDEALSPSSPLCSGPPPVAASALLHRDVGVSTSPQPPTPPTQPPLTVAMLSAKHYWWHRERLQEHEQLSRQQLVLQYEEIFAHIQKQASEHYTELCASAYSANIQALLLAKQEEAQLAWQRQDEAQLLISSFQARQQETEHMFWLFLQDSTHARRIVEQMEESIRVDTFVEEKHARSQLELLFHQASLNVLQNVNTPPPQDPFHIGRLVPTAPPQPPVPSHEPFARTFNQDVTDNLLAELHNNNNSNLNPTSRSSTQPQVSYFSNDDAVGAIHAEEELQRWRLKKVFQQDQEHLERVAYIKSCLQFVTEHEDVERYTLWMEEASSWAAMLYYHDKRTHMILEGIAKEAEAREKLLKAEERKKRQIKLEQQAQLHMLREEELLWEQHQDKWWIRKMKVLKYAEDDEASHRDMIHLQEARCRNTMELQLLQEVQLGLSWLWDLLRLQTLMREDIAEEEATSFESLIRRFEASPVMSNMAAAELMSMLQQVWVKTDKNKGYNPAADWSG